MIDHTEAIDTSWKTDEDRAWEAQSLIAVQEHEAWEAKRESERPKGWVVTVWTWICWIALCAMGVIQQNLG